VSDYQYFSIMGIGALSLMYQTDGGVRLLFGILSVAMGIMTALACTTSYFDKE
jgi:hypothetical protein